MIIKLEPGARDRWWKILADKEHIGNIILDPIPNDEVLLTIWLFKRYQHTGVGPYAIWLACEQSGRAKVFAHIRNDNRASMVAFRKAGFVKFDDDKFGSMLVWKRGDHDEGFRETLAGGIEDFPPVSDGGVSTGPVN